ncbi:MAG TPA: DUF4743 domain-containing protein [Acetobacteraceae bacterium]|nr:DUF4743 domain-containing protein [Acetobacteraceae bacterium]
MQPETDPEPFLRHVRACNNAVLPGSRASLFAGGERIGFVAPRLANRLAGFAEVSQEENRLQLHNPAALERIAQILASEGLIPWRNEAFDVRATPEGAVLGRIDRGALPSFGIISVGVHVNGLVERADGLHVWVGRRSPHKTLDPGKLDHLIAGGVPAGFSPEETLVKEAGEEASVDPALARRAVRVATVEYAMERAEGLRRDHLIAFDLALPEDFRPQPNDDEVAGFELWPVRRVLETVRDSDDFKFNVALVMIDLFLRRGLIAGGAASAIRAALDEGRARMRARARR